MTSTMIAFQTVTRNLPQTLARVAATPAVASSTARFKEGLAKVTSLDDFMANDSVYRYTLEAYGLGEMAYAKAFIRKVLEGGVSSQKSMANRLSDPRYRELAAAFDFASEATETTYFKTNIAKVKTVTAFVAPEAKRMFDYAIKAFGLESMVDTKDEKAAIETALILGSGSQIKFTDTALQKRFNEFLKAFDFAGKGLKATSDQASMSQVVSRYHSTARATQQSLTVEKYTRQRLEVDAGAGNDNVRLALYFQRKAPELKNAYQILADKALLKVVQTALGIPKESSAMPIDKQAEMLSKRLDLPKLKQPEELKTFLTRFSAMADMQTSRPGSAALTILVGPQVPAGVNTNLLMSIQSLRLGGI